MLIPKSLKDKIAKVFYDKSIDVLSKSTTIDAEGGAKETIDGVVRSFKGNAQFGSFELVRELYGLDCEIDITISCHETTIKVGDVLAYQGDVYEVTKVIPNDSHTMLIGAKYGSN